MKNITIDLNEIYEQQNHWLLSKPLSNEEQAQLNGKWQLVKTDISNPFQKIATSKVTYLDENGNQAEKTYQLIKIGAKVRDNAISYHSDKIDLQLKELDKNGNLVELHTDTNLDFIATIKKMLLIELRNSCKNNTQDYNFVTFSYYIGEQAVDYKFFNLKCESTIIPDNQHKTPKDDILCVRVFNAQNEYVDFGIGYDYIQLLDDYLSAQRLKAIQNVNQITEFNN